jgi:hypothetical protein
MCLTKITFLYLGVGQYFNQQLPLEIYLLVLVAGLSTTWSLTLKGLAYQNYLEG